MTDTVPNAVAVGDTVASQVTLTHANSGAEASLNDTLTAVTLVPSCGNRTISADCAASFQDPGVLVPSATGSGEVGTACAGVGFMFVLTDSAMGKYSIAWNGSIVLTPAGATHSCVIDFTTEVRKSPTIDANPGIVGSQTDQKGSAQATATNGTSGSGIGTIETNVLRYVTTVVTQVTPASIVMGGSFHDTATINSKRSGGRRAGLKGLLCLQGILQCAAG